MSGDLLSGAEMLGDFCRGFFDGVVLTGPICRGRTVGDRNVGALLSGPFCSGSF